MQLQNSFISFKIRKAMAVLHGYASISVKQKLIFVNWKAIFTENTLLSIK